MQTTTVEVSGAEEVNPNTALVTRQEKPVEDGFTMVRRLGRKGTLTVSPTQSTAGGSGGNLGRNLREIPKITARDNIAISNRFGNLETDMISAELREVVIMDEANKENKLISQR